MRRRVQRSPSGRRLRQKTEAVFSARPPAPAGTADQLEGMMIEAGVQQVDLEIQNEHLRQTQGQLEASRARYVELYDNAPVGYLTLDGRGTIIAANRTAAELLGLERERLLGLKLQSLMNESDSDAFHIQRMALLEGGGKQSSEVDLRRTDGATVRARLDSVADLGATPGHCNVALIDMTELRGTQADLRVTEARLRLIAENIEDVFYLRELDGVISYVSPAYERIWGRPASELAGKTDGWLHSVDPEDREHVKQAWERLREGTPISEVYRIRRPDGSLRWVQSRGFPIADQGGARRSVGVLRDVTHERLLERALRQAQKMEAVGTLASGVAHNLRNILQAILNFIEVARIMTTAGEPVAETLDRVTNATRRGAVLIDQLMTFARKEEPAGRSPVRVDDVLREAADLIRPLVGKAIAVCVDAGAPGGVVMAHPVELEQVFLNLAANARDAMPRGGTLTIASREAMLDEPRALAQRMSTGPHVIITVQDTGEGMDAATKARVFEPFFTTKEVGKGTGLGLSTVYAVVQQFGGFVEVDSAPGAGATFTICLPAAGRERSLDGHGGDRKIAPRPAADLDEKAGLED